jgi:hypothetical protein
VVNVFVLALVGVAWPLTSVSRALAASDDAATRRWLAFVATLVFGVLPAWRVAVAVGLPLRHEATAATLVLLAMGDATGAERCVMRYVVPCVEALTRPLREGASRVMHMNADEVLAAGEDVARKVWQRRRSDGRACGDDGATPGDDDGDDAPQSAEATAK